MRGSGIERAKRYADVACAATRDRARAVWDLALFASKELVTCFLSAGISMGSWAARFSSCLFSGVEPGVVGARAALVFEACRFDAIADDPRERLPDARFVRCEFGPDAAARLPRRELSVRFPEFDPLVHR